MRIGAATRTVLTAINGTTLVGLVIAAASGAKVHLGPDGILVAEDYQGRLVKQTCFTVGSVVICRRSADWLLHDRHVDLLAHEARHASQYALLGPLFWPAYWVACGYSYAMTGSYGVRNAFEKHAGLKAGGYPETHPLRPWAAKLVSRSGVSRSGAVRSGAVGGSAATGSTRPPGETPSPH